MAATATTKVTFALARRPGEGPPEVQALARASGLHPDLVARLIRLGALDGLAGTPAAAARLARVVRLRRDLGVGWSGAVLASELLARIDELELRLRRYER
jgi:hypothetical protein